MAWVDVGAENQPALHPPPLALLAALLALLFAILATAQPALRLPLPLDERTATVIVDRGVTMSSPARRDDVIAQANAAMVRRGVTDVNLINLPGGERIATSVNRWTKSVADATAVDTISALPAAIAKALLDDSKSPVLVLTDQPIAGDNPRVLVIAPSKPLGNVGIVRFALRDHPKPQAMVTIRNDSPGGRAVLKIESANKTIEREIGLPTRGTEQNFFLDLETLGPTARASIDVQDDLDADNAAYLARQHDRPRLEIRGPVPPEVQRIVEAYQKARPAGETGATIAIAESKDLLHPDEPSILIASPDSAIDVSSHPLGANIDWTHAADKPRIALNDHRVTITPPTEQFARTPDFVILWTNIIDHLAATTGGDTFASTQLDQLDPEWKPDSSRPLWPGFYHQQGAATGPTTRAANAAIVHVPAARPPDPRPRLAALARRDPPGLNLLPYLAIASIGCVLIAAALWPGRNLTRFSAGRTV